MTWPLGIVHLGPEMGFPCRKTPGLMAASTFCVTVCQDFVTNTVHLGWCTAN